MSFEDEFMADPAPGISGDLPAHEHWVRDAEAERRAGRPAAARRLLEAGLVDEPHDANARIALALACLDLGEAEEARRALEPALARFRGDAPEPLALEPAVDEPFAVQSDPLADLAENELERAFEHAEAEPVEVWTTNRVAEAAVRAVEAAEPAEGAELAEARELESDLVADADSPFATETVAELLERQGDPERAHAIRRTLRRAPAERERWVGTLERWLDNLRRASR